MKVNLIIMSNNKQSSIEFIIESLMSRNLYTKELLEEFEQAKAMHKSEIIWAHGIKMKGVNNHKCVSGEQYYNENYGGNNEQQ
jgi:hypothetical protein